MPPSVPRRHDHGHGLPAKVAAGTPPHDEAAYGLLRTLVFAAADAAAALAADDLAGYRKVLPALREAPGGLSRGLSPRRPAGALAAFAGKLADGPDLDAVRRAFEPFSTAVADLARAEHVHHREGVTDLPVPHDPGARHRPLALAQSNQLRNPFFGSAMLSAANEVQ